jgi:putative transposase
LPKNKIIASLEIDRGKFYDWTSRFGKANEHNCYIPRDHWLSDEEKLKILQFFEANPLNGYKRLTYMMIDQDIVAVSPTTVYRVLKGAGMLDNRKFKPSKKGTGFVQPKRVHEHWHIDVSYINICGTFYYMCSILDGFSRYVVHWDIKESMTEQDIQIIIQKAKEKFPGFNPRLISDRGPQFIAKEFKGFIKTIGMTQVWTSPYYPQSNGKIERYHREIKTHCIRAYPPKSLQEAKDRVSGFVDNYNGVRLHAAIGYITPRDMMDGKAEAILNQRELKIAAARDHRKNMRQEQRMNDLETAA